MRVANRKIEEFKNANTGIKGTKKTNINDRHIGTNFLWKPNI